MAPQPGLDRRPIHAALYRPVLFAGLTRPILIAEVTAVVAVSFALGARWATAGFVLVYVLLVHPVLVWLTRKDPDMIEIFVRSARSKDFYLAQPGLRSPSLPVYPSIPTVG